MECRPRSGYYSPGGSGSRNGAEELVIEPGRSQARGQSVLPKRGQSRKTGTVGVAEAGTVPKDGDSPRPLLVGIASRGLSPFRSHGGLSPITVRSTN
jgi:hypothetical protein